MTVVVPRISSTARDELTHRIQQAAVDWDVAGSVVCVVAGDDTAVFCHGLADVTRGIPMTASTKVPLASLTKAMVAVVVARAVREGHLAWTDRLAPELTPPGAPVIDARSLLSHSAGIPPYALLLLSEQVPSFESFVERCLRSLPLGADPGGRYVYSSASYVVAARLAETSTGRPWSELFAELLHTIGADPRDLACEAPEPPYLVPQPRVLGDPAALLERTSPLFTAINGMWLDSDALAALLRLHLFGHGRESSFLTESELTVLRTPQIAMPSTSSTYPRDMRAPMSALGWVAGIIDGEPAVAHAGTCSTAWSNACLFPRLNTGVASFATNDTRHLATEPGCCFHCVVDRAVLEVVHGQRDTKPSAPVDPVVDHGQLDLPGDAADDTELDGLRGRYTHPGLGILEIGTSGGAAATYGVLGGEVRSSGGTPFINWDEHWLPSTLEPAGDTGLLIKMEVSVPPIRFERTPANEEAG